MERIPVQSSNLAEVGYDQDEGILEVLFNNGSIYHYFNVPASVFQQLLHAESKGTFHYHHIRGHFRYTKL